VTDVTDPCSANINVHTAAIWTIIEVFKDQNLLSRVRAELRTVEFSAITSSQDLEKLLSLSLLQSVYAEVLRLRVEVQSVFYSEREDIEINEWRFPKKSLLLVSAGPAHRDPNVWNTREGEHPVNTFWADRFLVYPNDPRSGPKRKTPEELARFQQDQTNSTITDRGKPRYVTGGMGNSYMPYGVGERTCPGRFFAQRLMIAFCAQIVNDFDIELLTTTKNFESSSTFYGLGTQRPLGNVPFRIRRRARC
jgi:cytochrome P450